MRPPQIPPAVCAAVDALRDAVEHANLSRRVRLLVAAVVRKEIVPKRKPGRKNRRIDRAYADYKAGKRGLKLYRRHIPRLAKMSRWRRRIEQNRLLKTLQKRAERERKRQATTPSQGSVAPTIGRVRSHPDNSG